MMDRVYKPNQNDKLYERLLKRIGLKSKPSARKIAIQPLSGAVALECFENVRNLVKRDGGEIVYGWCLWQTPPFFVEAEHHAVYRAKGKTKLVDITPNDGTNEKSRTFVEDKRATYDFDNPNFRRGNLRVPIYDALCFHELIQIHEAIEKILDPYPTGNIELTTEDSKKYRELKKKQGDLERECFRYAQEHQFTI